MENEYILVLITAPSEEVGRQIARTLVEGKLAACANIFPRIRSIYSWQGQIQDEEEVLLMVKTRASLFSERLVRAVKAVHPYEVPEIIALPLRMGAQDYLDWIGEVTAG